MHESVMHSRLGNAPDEDDIIDLYIKLTARGFYLYQWLEIAR